MFRSKSQAELLDRVGEVQDSPTTYTMLARLKSLLTNIVLGAGSAIIGKVEIDQTTPGTTNGVVVNASALPTGAATSAKQDTGNTSVASIDTKFGEVQTSPTAYTLLARLKDLLTGIVLAAGSAIIGKVGIDQTTPGTTDSVSVATGQGAGATIGATGDAAVVTDTTGTLSGKIRGLVKWVAERMPAALGQGTMAQSLPVVLPSNQSSIPVASTLQAGSAIVGAAKDAGENWAATHTVTNSADMTSAANVSPAPTGGQKLVLTDLVITVDTAMSVTIKEETSGTTIHGPFYMAANSSFQITTRSRMSKLATADKKYQAQASVAGNITVETWVYSEA